MNARTPVITKIAEATELLCECGNEVTSSLACYVVLHFENRHLLRVLFHVPIQILLIHYILYNGSLCHYHKNDIL